MFVPKNDFYTFLRIQCFYVKHSTQDIADACLFLARHYCEEKLYDEATTYATKARDYVEVKLEITEFCPNFSGFAL